jgi:hypothetical protein
VLPHHPFGVVNSTDPLGELRIVDGPLLTCRDSFQRGRNDERPISTSSRDRNTLEGVLVVGDELEAVHQRVSPAKYLAARRRISRSVTPSPPEWTRTN